MKQNIWGALESEDQGSDGLQNTEGRDALVVEEVSELGIVTLLVALLEQLAHDPQVGVTELLAQGHGEGSQLGGKDLDEVLHHVGKSVDIHLVGQLQELLHDGRDAGLHGPPNELVPNQGLQSEGRGDADGKGRIGHALNDVAVDDKQVGGVLEVELLKLLDGIARTRAQIALGVREVGENVADQEVLDLVGDGRFFAQDDGGENADHAQGTLLGHVVLLSVRRQFVLVDHLVDELEDLESLFPPRLGQGDEEIGGRHVRCRYLLVEVQLAVKVLVRVILELLQVFLGETEDGKDEMGHEVIEMPLEMAPHVLGPDALIQENDCVRETRSAQPHCLGYPLLDLLKIMLQDLRRDLRRELVGEVHSAVVAGLVQDRRRVSVPFKPG